MGEEGWQLPGKKRDALNRSEGSSKGNTRIWQ